MNKAPAINNGFLVIVNRDERDLAAVILSFLHQQDQYLAVFEYPVVSVAKPDIQPLVIGCRPKA